MPCLVAGVDEEAEVVGRAVARGRRVVAGHLIAPASRRTGAPSTGSSSTCVKPSAAHVLDEARRELAVAERAVALLGHARPRAEVHLVDRPSARARCRAARAPASRRRRPRRGGQALHDARPCPARRSVRARERVGLEAERAVAAEDLVLVERARARRRARRARRRPSRRAGASGKPAVPAAEVADDADALGRSAPRPRRRRRPCRRRARGCAPSTVPQPAVGALAEEVHRVAERRPKRRSSRSQTGRREVEAQR